MNNSPTPNICPGPCSTRWRRAEAQRLETGVEHNLTPRAGNPLWCDPCARHLRYQLATLPDLTARLLLEMENATAADAEHVSGSKERPIHEREKYSFCIEDIDGVLDDWATAVRQDRNLVAARPLQQGRRITASARLLLVQFDWIIGENPAPEASEAFGADIIRVYRQAAKLTATDEVRPERCDGVACPRCDTMSLEHEIDWQGRTTGYIVCRTCETLLSGSEYERWLKMAAEPIRKAVLATYSVIDSADPLHRPITIEQAMQRTSRSRQTIDRWIRQDRLRVVYLEGVATVNERDVVTTEREVRNTVGGRPRKSAA